MHELFRKAPYTRFMEFIAQDADRRSVLCSTLEETGLDFTEIALGKNRHIAVFPRGRQAAFSGTVFTAHYDRAEGSPGANDNGAAVFMLVDAAMSFHRIENETESGLSPVIFFTDKEELKTGETLEKQGAYTLAFYLKENGLDGKIFTFDACGSGDTLIVSTAADTLLWDAGSRTTAFRRRVRELRTTALEAARDAEIEKILLLPTPFSDDAGFFRAGLCAQTITVLPSGEAAAFSALVRRQSAGGSQSDAHRQNGAGSQSDAHKQSAGRGSAARALLSSAVSPPVDRRLIPETWRNLNGPGDSHIRLTTEHWKKIVSFAEALGQKP